jgi:bacillithiol biosynthesis cysteine-adding enzyme BshC
MGCPTIPLRRLPHQPKLFLRFLEDFPSVQQFYSHPPAISEALAAGKSIPYPPERRAALTEILGGQNNTFGAGAAVRANIGRLATGSVAVVTGQQAGLFSGPAYAIYKALTAIRIARELTDRGLDAVPVFWIATEDHDLDEVRRAVFFADGRMANFELPGDGALHARPVGRIALGDEVRGLTDRARRVLSGAAASEIGALLAECYRPEETYGSAFAKLFARLFSEQGLILLDPLDPQLHRLAAPVMRHALECRDELTEALLRRDKELEAAGFVPQVKVTSRSTQLFHLGADERQAITANGSAFHCAGRKWSREGLLAEIVAAPENFSPSALLRPVIQDFLLPTAAYVGGPSEISYFAQSEVLYRGLLGRMPVLLPRADFTLIDPKAERLMKRYGLQVEDVWQGSQRLRRKMEEAVLPKALAGKFKRTGTAIAKLLAGLAGELTRLDSTLSDAAATARRKIEYQFTKLRGKASRATDRTSGLLEAHQQFLEHELFPNKAPQSRALCLLPFLARWGTGGLAELESLSGSEHLGTHGFVSIP